MSNTTTTTTTTTIERGDALIIDGTSLFSIAGGGNNNNNNNNNDDIHYNTTESMLETLTQDVDPSITKLRFVNIRIPFAPPIIDALLNVINGRIWNKAIVMHCTAIPDCIIVAMMQRTFRFELYYSTFTESWSIPIRNVLLQQKEKQESVVTSTTTTTKEGVLETNNNGDNINSESTTTTNNDNDDNNIIYPLTELKFRTQFTNDSIQPLLDGIANNKHSNLRRLYFTSSFQGDSLQMLGRALATCSGLQLLSFYSCEFESETALDTLLQTLVTLPDSSNNDNDCSSIPFQLKVLELRDNSHFSTIGLSHFIRHTKSLCRLILYHPPLTIAETNIQVPRINMEALCVALQQNFDQNQQENAIHSLSFVSNALGDSAADWIATIKSSALLELDLESNALTDVGIQTLAKAIPDCFPNLRKLYLWNNPFEGDGSRSILRMISTHPTKLEHVSMFTKFRCLPQIQFYTHLNKGGNHFIENWNGNNKIPIGLWSLVLERVNRQHFHSRQRQQNSTQQHQAQVIYCFLREHLVSFL